MTHHEMANTMADIGMTRAEYGSGSMFQRTSDWRWIAIVEAGYTASGGRKRPTVSGKGCIGGCKKRCPHIGAIKRKLRDKRLELETQKARPTKRTVSIARYSTTWLENIQTKISPSAYTTDKAAVRTIVAAIGAVNLADVTPDDVRRVARYLRERKKSTSTALRYHGSLMRLLKAAAIDGYAVPPNAMLVDNPTAAVNDREAVPPDEAVLALAQIAKRDDGSRWALAFLQGLRQMEALGLTWGQVDLDKGTITVSWQIKSLRYVDRAKPELGFQMPDGYEARHLAGSTHLVRPKSTAGWRVQPLVPWAVNALRAWREVAPGNEHDLVWPGRRHKGTTWPRNPASDRAEWEAIQKAAKIAHETGRPYLVHEIRHGTATLLLELGVPESTRIAIMGHSSIASTRTYEHVDVTMAREALEKVATRLQLTTPD